MPTLFVLVVSRSQEDRHGIADSTEVFLRAVVKIVRIDFALRCRVIREESIAEIEMKIRIVGEDILHGLSMDAVELVVRIRRYREHERLALIPLSIEGVFRVVIPCPTRRTVDHTIEILRIGGKAADHRLKDLVGRAAQGTCLVCIES